MDAISRVQVVSGLVGRGGGHLRDGSTASSGLGKDKERYLGDYVSRDKMLAVRDGCSKVLCQSRLIRARLRRSPLPSTSHSRAQGKI